MTSPTPNQSRALNIVVSGNNLNPGNLGSEALINLIKARSNDINGTTFISGTTTDGTTPVRILDASGNDPITVAPNTLVYASVTGVAVNLTDSIPVAFNGLYAASRTGTGNVTAFTNVTGVSNGAIAIAPATGQGAASWFTSTPRQSVGITYTGVAAKTIVIRAKIDFIFMPFESEAI